MRKSGLVLPIPRPLGWFEYVDGQASGVHQIVRVKKIQVGCDEFVEADGEVGRPPNHIVNALGFWKNYKKRGKEKQPDAAKPEIILRIR